MADIIEIGQVGLGDWGKNLLRNFAGLGRCRVKTACDTNAAVLGKLSESYPGIKFSDKYDDILDDSAIKAVVIATPPALHFEMAKSALEAGKDVFVEKPFVLDPADGLQLVEMAEKLGRILMVGHIMLHHPATTLLKKYIVNGELGKIYYLYSQRINLGKVRDCENSLWSFAPHDISLMLYLLDDMPCRVNATGASYLQDHIEDVTFMTLHFADGKMAHVHVSWLDPHKERKLTIVGSKKMAVFDDTEASEKIWLYDRGVNSRLDYSTFGEYLGLRIGDIVLPRIQGGEPLQAECRHFLDCIIHRTTPISDGRDGLRVLNVLQAAQASLDQGGIPVAIPPPK